MLLLTYRVDDMISEAMMYEDYEDFCKRADELKKAYAIRSSTPFFLIGIYRDYIYSHKQGTRFDETLNNKCFEWILSTTYEPMDKNDLYSMLGQIRRGNGHKRKNN